MIRKYDVGTTVTIDATFRSRKKELLDPTSAKVYIYDPNNVVKCNGLDMTKDSLGVYYYNHQTAEVDAVGIYTVKLKIVSGGFTVINKSELFELE